MTLEKSIFEEKEKIILIIEGILAHWLVLSLHVLAICRDQGAATGAVSDRVG